MSSTNKTANYQLSQFVGTDIPSILNDYNGDMRKIDTAIKAVANAEGSSASDIAGLQATVGQHTTEISDINSTVNALSGRVVGIESKIPANASESNKLITAQDIPEIPDITQLTQDVVDLQEEVSDMGGDVKAIQLCVPANASEENKFATMADIGQTTLPDNVMFADSVVNTTFNLNNYADMGHMLKAVYDHIRQIYETNIVNISVVLKVSIENKIFILYPSESGVTSQSPIFNFSGHSINLGGANAIVYGFMQMINSDTSGYFVERFLTFANSYWGTDSNITDGTVTGHEIKHTADETTTAPSIITVCKMVDKTIV